ncbi:MAG: ABC transporter ATP-binding protein [Planctomycetota bacterium]|jgi:putative ABC transport system ATP-binding protein
MAQAKFDYQDVVVRTIDVKKVYGEGEAAVHALRGITCDIVRGEYLSIMGPSGSGKSTLFNMIGALDAPTDGMVFIDEVDVAQLDPFEMAWLRCRKIGYIFQSYNIMPIFTALENVMTPMTFAGVSDDEARERAVDLLKLVGLGTRVFHRPFELSGGQQQRVAIARSLANNPSIVLADEPTANLDTKTGEEINDILFSLKEEKGVTIICATHDMKMLNISDRIMWISDGAVDRIENRADIDVEIGSIDGEI